MPLFDQYVSQSKPSRKRQALIIASIALHAIAAMVIVVWSVIHVDEIVAPLLTLTFLNAAPPPPPPPAGGPKTAEHKPKPKPTTTTQPVQIVPVVKEQPEPTSADTSDEPDGEPNGQPGGQPGGDPNNGVPGGNGPPGGGGEKVVHDGPPRMVASMTLMASQLQHPDPHLPEFFRNAHAHQTVSGRYKFCLGTDGRINDVTVMAGIPGVDEVIMAQMKSGWTYKPQAVPVCAVALIAFKIN